MAPDQALFDEIYRRKLANARRFTPEERLLASFNHSDAMAEMMREGVRHQYPETSEEEITRRLQERIEMAKRARELQ